MAHSNSPLIAAYRRPTALGTRFSRLDIIAKAAPAGSALRNGTDPESLSLYQIGQRRRRPGRHFARCLPCNYGENPRSGDDVQEYVARNPGQPPDSALPPDWPLQFVADRCRAGARPPKFPLLRSLDLLLAPSFTARQICRQFSAPSRNPSYSLRWPSPVGAGLLSLPAMAAVLMLMPSSVAMHGSPGALMAIPPDRPACCCRDKCRVLPRD